MHAAVLDMVLDAYNVQDLGKKELCPTKYRVLEAVV